MSDYGYDEYNLMEQAPLPEAPRTVSEPQVPTAVATWEWTTNRIIAVALGILTLGFGVWFLMEYTSSKNAHQHGGTDGGE